MRWGNEIARSQLTATSRRRLKLATVVLSLLTLLDLVGVMLLATVGVALVTLVSPESFADGLPPQIEWITETVRAPIWLLAFAAVSALALKSWLSWIASRRILQFMAKQQAYMARQLFLKYATSSLSQSQELSVAAVANGIISGARASANFLSSRAVLIADGVLVAGLSILLAATSPGLFLFSALYFGALGFLVSKLVGRRSHRASTQLTAATISGTSSVIQAVGLARELRVYKLQPQWADDVQEKQSDAADAQAAMLLWGQLPRYILEVGLVLGLVGASGIVVATQPPERAAFSLSLFVAAASRLVPAIQRINGSWTQVQIALGQMTQARPILDLDSEAPTDARDPFTNSSINDDCQLQTAAAQPRQRQELVLDGIGYTYPNSEAASLTDIHIRLPMPGSVALVGPSGAGKSTLADVLLGLRRPTQGRIYVERSGSHSVDMRVAFVSQDVFLANADVRTNVTLNLNGDETVDELVWAALRRAQLDSVIRALPQGLETPVGERGLRLSGGQRQRLGLARALFRQPEVLILDEATSALDSETEFLVTEAIRGLSNATTTITIAHRLATIRDADLVCYLSEGRLVASGKFDELLTTHPDFARVASLQGLPPSPLKLSEETTSRLTGSSD